MYKGIISFPQRHKFWQNVRRGGPKTYLGKFFSNFFCEIKKPFNFVV